MSDPLFRIFHSKIVAFDRCRKQYWFRYISALPRPPDIPNPAGCVGTGVHRALKTLCDTDVPEDGAHELDVYLRMPAHECAGPGTEAYASAFVLYERGCAAHASIVSEDRWAELDTWVPWDSRRITVSARMDRADRLASTHWQIIDWKTGAYDFDDLTDQQLDIGHLAVRTALRLPAATRVTAIAWNLRTGHRRVRELDRGDAAATMRKLAGIAARMQAVVEFEAMPGPGCRFCEWRPQCLEADAAEAGDWSAELEED